MSCQNCKRSTNGPRAFLLTCRGCGRSWHHRCHFPPVEDDELIQRIRATNARDTTNNLSDWKCRRCKKSVSGTPSATTSREPTVVSDSREKNLACTVVTGATTSASTPSVSSTGDVRVKQESSSTGDARLSNDRERNKRSDRQELTEAVPAKRTLSAKKTKLSEAHRPHVEPQTGPTQPRDTDVQMADTTPIGFTPQEEKRSPQRPFSSAPSHHVKGARKFVNAVPETSSEDDVEMEVQDLSRNFSESTPRATSRGSFSGQQAVGPKSVAETAPHAPVVSSTNEWEQAVRPAAIQPQASRDAIDDIDDDPEDLYGPPVERRIIRILPSLAEELKEQQRRVAAEKEKRRAPLAPDWISAKHVHDPLWKEIPTGGRRRRKSIARKLGENGLNVNELVGCFTVQNWVREHKT